MDRSVKVVVIIEKINKRYKEPLIDNDITNLNVASNDGRVISLHGTAANLHYNLFEEGSNIISDYNAKKFIKDNIKNEIKKKIKETIETFDNCIVFSCKNRSISVSQKKKKMKTKQSLLLTDLIDKKLL